MESEKFSNVGLYRLGKVGESCRSSSDSVVPELQPPQLTDSVAPEVVIPLEVAVMDNSVADDPIPVAREKRRRGRPPKGEGKVPAKKRVKREDEDVCFICFDGGSLVLCDEGDCPKAYHPACIKRDESFFTETTRWTCGWHICSKCQNSPSRYMCYTCTYSLCKSCTKDADFVRVRGNKGFCLTCYPVIMMIENVDQGSNETVKVDFDDKLSWEYLFKVYWVCLKNDLSLTVDEIIRAQKPSIAPNKETQRENSSAAYHFRNIGTTASENPITSNVEISYSSVKSVCDNNNNNNNNNNSDSFTDWASKDLLSFVAYMRNGDTSVLSQKEVQALLFDYIKRNNLRDPHLRSEIICDSELESLFKKPRVRHFEMLTLLESHFPPDEESQKDEFGGGVIDPAHNLPLISENCGDNDGKKNEERVDINRVNEENYARGKLQSHVESSGSTNNILNDQTSLKSETSPASLSTGSMLSASDREAENSWHYRDPNGKVQGPFRMEQFYKWSQTGIFPPEMRIWKINTEERDSVLLSDVIKGQVPSPHEVKGTPESLSTGIVTDADSNGKGTPDSTGHRCDEPGSGSSSADGIDKEADTNGSKLEIVKDDVSVSKCSEPDPPKVINSYLNLPQINYVERSSPVTEQLHEISLHCDRSDLAQPWRSQENIVSQPTERESQENQVNEQVYQVNNDQHYQVNEQPYQVNQQHYQANQHHYSEEALRKNTPVDNYNYLQDFSMPMPKTNTGLPEPQTFEKQLMWQQPHQVPGQNLSIPNATDQGEKVYFPNQNAATQNSNLEKVRAATENTHSFSPNCGAQDSSWSSASSLVLGGGNQLPISVSSLRPNDVATPTSKLDEPSPPNPVPNASSWLAMMTEPLDFNVLSEESVSDLLAEVDAMETNPYVDDLFDDSKTDWFTSLGGFSP